jgi:hypothetical protein
VLSKFERNRYTDLGLEMLKSLEKNQLKNGTLYDKFDNSITPDNHYALAFFALAGCLSSTFYNTETKKAEKALEYFTHIPSSKMGHHEFNLLACLLIQEILTEGRLADLAQSSCIDLITNYSKKGPFEAGKNTAHGNNWVAIQALVLLLRYRQFKAPDDLRKADFLIDHYVLRWQLADGLFYDYPRSTSALHFTIPLSYHAKFCMVLSFCAQITGRLDIYHAVLRGLDALSKLVSPSGEGFYFGRTNNAIFGYVSALYAYETMIQHLFSCEPTEENTNRVVVYSKTADALFFYLKTMQELDGSLRLTPGSFALQKSGWDSYMHHTVYNAYASAILLMTPHMTIIEKARPNDKKTDFLRDSGFLIVRSKRNFLVINTKSQGTDLRYSSMIPLIWETNGIALIAPQPIHRSSGGFIPIVTTKNKRISPSDWHNVSVVNNDYGFAIFSEGELIDIPKFVDTKVTFLLQRFKSSKIIRSLLRNSGLIQLAKLERMWNTQLPKQRVPMSLQLYRGVVVPISGEELFIVDALKATNNKGDLRIIPPSFLALSKIADKLSVNRGKLLVKLEGCGDSNFKFEILSPETDKFNRISEVDTSKGPGTLLTPRGAFLANTDDTLHSIVWLKVYKKNQEPHCQIEVKKNTVMINEDTSPELEINTINKTFLSFTKK